MGDEPFMDSHERARSPIFCMGLLKKAASGVLAIFLCSRIASTFRAQKWLWPCWTNFFEPTPRPLTFPLFLGIVTS
jgi:hypothetical protein